ncbi:transport and Golgi organization protein 6 homolog [Antedon mediterranea]|uniref:transport and Golgi organization protein 6 homolog n=1 Tax=Antedon mediterranea TaxID=105859 RepID=UPI003AF4B9B1
MAAYSSRDVLHAITILVSPIQQKPENITVTEYGLSSLFQINLKELHSKIHEDRFSELHQSLPKYEQFEKSSEYVSLFLETCSQLLLCLKRSLLLNIKQEKKKQKENEAFIKKRPHDYAPPLAPDALSISDQKIVTTLTQFIVCLGISPNLDAGVGIPLSMRSEFSEFLTETRTFSDMNKKQNLVKVLNILLECTKVTTLGSVILSKFLNDFLAALLQLSFKPFRKQIPVPGAKRTPDDPLAGSSVVSEDRLASSSGTSEGQLAESSLAITDNLTDDRHIWRKELDALLNKLYQPMVIRELLLLQGGPLKTSGTKQKSPLSPAPAWLRKACGKLLSERLMKPDGVYNVLSGILHCTGGDGNWKQCEMIGKLLVNCPKHIPLDVYYQSICPQVLDLVACKDVLTMKKFLRIACSFINNVITRHYQLALELLIHPLQEPLLKCVHKDINTLSSPGSIVVLENSLSSCIDSLHRVYVIGGSEASHDLLQSIQPIIHPLFKLCIFLNNGISHLRSPVEDLIHQYFKMTDTSISIQVLQHLTLLQHNSHLDVMSPHLNFLPGSAGGAIVAVSEDNGSSETASIDVVGDQDVAATVLFEIFGKSKMNKLMGDFFIAVLNELTNIMSSNTEDDAVHTSEKPPVSEVLLQFEIDQSDKLHNIQHALVVLNLVAKICDEMGPDVLENKKQMIAFIEATLQRVCKGMERTRSQENSAMFEDETLSMALGLLGLIVADIKQVEKDLKKMLSSLLPLLTVIADNYGNEYLKEMALNLLISIGTHGALKVDAPKDVRPRMKSELAKQAKDLLSLQDKHSPKSCSGENDAVVESKEQVRKEMPNETVLGQKPKKLSHSSKDSLRSTELKHLPVSDGTTKTRKTKEEPDEEIVSESFDEAYKDLFDPLLPVRGHALIALSKLLHAKDPKAMQKKDTLFVIFKEKLTDDDSYIYLAAIRGLEAMADVYPDQVIPALCEEYANSRQAGCDAEIRMKIGESLVKATRNLGELVPHYRQDLLNCILTVTKHPDSDLRASSLTNLGEVCKLLRFSLGSVIYEVMNCLVSILKTDSEIIVKRACVNVVTLMLRGLGEEAMSVLESSLLDLYRSLKHILATENDDVVKLHAELALNEMDLFMREYLFPKQTLSKKIVVLP